MRIPVGPYTYRLELVEGWVVGPGGERCYGIADCSDQVIRISGAATPERRLATWWHEFAHAIQHELDIRHSAVLDAEELANLIGLGMSFVSPKLIARIHLLLTRGIDADDVVMPHGVEEIVPVVHCAKPPSPKKPWENRLN